MIMGCLLVCMLTSLPFCDCVPTQKMVNTSDHAFLTVAQSGDLTKESLRELLVEAGGMEGAVIVQETHVADGVHLHAAIWGQFRSDRYAKKLHTLLPGQHVDCRFRHAPKKGSKVGPVWPYFEMLNYITNPAKDKKVDPDPLVWVEGRIDPSLNECLDGYSEKYTPRTLKEKMAMAERMKAAGGSLNDCIVMAAEGVTKDTYGDFNILLQYFKTLPSTPPKLTVDGETPKPWQQLVVDWALAPCPTGTNNRGLWLTMPSESGKTWVLNYIADLLADRNERVFRPGMRPDGSFDGVSLLRYNGEPLIFFDDIGATVKEVDLGVSRVLWKNKMIDLFKMVANNTPIPIDFGGEHKEICIKGKVLVTSNFGLPDGRNVQDGEALRRRYIEVEYTDLQQLTAALKTE